MPQWTAASVFLALAAGLLPAYAAQTSKPPACAADNSVNAKALIEVSTASIDVALVPSFAVRALAADPTPDIAIEHRKALMCEMAKGACCHRAAGGRA